MSLSLTDKLYAITDKGPVGPFTGAGVDFGGLYFLGSDPLCGEDQLAGDMGRSAAYLGSVCRGSSWRRVPTATHPVASFFAPLPAIVILAAGLLYVSL